MVGSSPFGSSGSFARTSATIPNMLLSQNLNYGVSVYGSPLTSSEYKQYIESEYMKPEAEYILDSQHSSGRYVTTRCSYEGVNYFVKSDAKGKTLPKPRPS